MNYPDHNPDNQDCPLNISYMQGEQECECEPPTPFCPVENTGQVLGKGLYWPGGNSSLFSD